MYIVWYDMHMRYPRRFLCLMSPRQWERLGALSASLDLTRGATLRYLINVAAPENAAESLVASRLASARGIQRAIRQKLDPNAIPIDGAEPVHEDKPHWEPD